MNEQPPSKERVEEISTFLACYDRKGMASDVERLLAEIVTLREDCRRWENAHKILLSENARLQLQLKSERERVEKAAQQILEYQTARAAPEPAAVQRYSPQIRIEAGQQVALMCADAEGAWCEYREPRAAQPPGDGQA